MVDRRGLACATSLALFACTPAQSPERTCDDLTDGLAFEPPSRGDVRDRVILVPPRGLRIERQSVGDGQIRRCEVKLVACDAKDPPPGERRAADLRVALENAELKYALAQSSTFGAPQGPTFVLIHGRDKLTVGPPCPNPAGSCREPPVPVLGALRLLSELYQQALDGVCATFPH